MSPAHLCLLFSSLVLSMFHEGSGVRGQGPGWLSLLIPLYLIPLCSFKLRDGPFLGHLLTRSET